MADKATYKIVGYSFYDANGRKGFYLNLTENYLERDGAVGSFAINMSAPYVDIEKIKAVKMSVDRPATIEILQVQQPMGRQMVVMCQELISIKPFNILDFIKSFTPDEFNTVTSYLNKSSSVPPPSPKPV